MLHPQGTQFAKLPPFLQLMASKWTVPILYELQQDTLRYSAIEKALPGITQRALTNTLRSLERNGLAERKAYPTIPPQVEYKLTRLGLDVLRFCENLSDWVEKHEAEFERVQKAYDRHVKR